MSSVTAVPLQPLPKGTVAKLWLGIIFLLLLAGGLAWLGTTKLQYTTLESGVRYRVIEEGKGDKITPDDLVQLYFEFTRVSDRKVVLSSVRPEQPDTVTVNTFFKGLQGLLLEMREGGVYRATATAEQINGGPIPPGQPVRSEDLIDVQVRIVGVAKGMGAMQGMSGPDGPGGPPPGAMPADAMPPGAMPPGAMPPGGPGGP